MLDVLLYASRMEKRRFLLKSDYPLLLFKNRKLKGAKKKIALEFSRIPRQVAQEEGYAARGEKCANRSAKY